MMIYTVLRQNNDETANLFFTWEDFHKATFSPDIEPICIIELGKIKGKTYKAKKAAIESKAIEYSNNQAGGLSYGEIADIQGYFETYGKRYGLLREFYENAIC